MSTKITPTVGRVVYFNPNQMQLAAHLAAPDEGQALAAIITAVLASGRINLGIFDATGQLSGMSNVQLVQEGELLPAHGTGFAYWMPYQLAQAGIKPLPPAPIGPGRMFAHTAEEFPELASLLAKDFARPAATGDAAIEHELQSKGLTAPRVTPADIEANIASEHYFTAADGVVGVLAIRDGAGKAPGDDVKVAVAADIPDALDLLTFCVLVLRNGFTVTGESACASPENFDAEIGRKIARENAINKVWPLMGYALKDRLANIAQHPLTDTHEQHAGQQTDREKAMEELLRSACAIAERKGDSTAWDRFAASVHELGLNGVTARTYRILTSDVE